ncbi:hypothetical protein DRE_07657 [Drechslerella stenobrocha 248]|uniref:Uncharacterized protein n=1 Tax=Drechslerella stenobrocha 248 TaxID=1043628 RepID=W7I3V4_9PEZI|nr:hypothetical protein DRE_07657 [Drechslerella stenobrocha 248]
MSFEFTFSCPQAPKAVTRPPPQLPSLPIWPPVQLPVQLPPQMTLLQHSFFPVHMPMQLPIARPPTAWSTVKSPVGMVATRIDKDGNRLPPRPRNYKPHPPTQRSWLPPSAWANPRVRRHGFNILPPSAWVHMTPPRQSRLFDIPARPTTTFSAFRPIPAFPIRAAMKKTKMYVPREDRKPKVSAPNTVKELTTQVHVPTPRDEEPAVETVWDTVKATVGFAARVCKCFWPLVGYFAMEVLQR